MGRRSNRQIIERAVEDGVVTWSELVKLLDLLLAIADK